MPKSNRSLTLLSLISGVSLIVSTFGVTPANSTSTSICQDAVQSVRSQIQTGRNLEVLPAIKRNDGHPDAPQGRPVEYIIPLRGTESLNILSSPQLMTNLARQIINQCANASLVTFGIANSGSRISFGLMPDGGIIGFRCIEPRGLRPRWGQIICT